MLDNHDDFGGHAKRNEHTIDGELRIGHQVSSWGYGMADSTTACYSEASPSCAASSSPMGAS